MAQATKTEPTEPTEPTGKLRQAIALESAKMAGTFREQVKLLYESKTGKNFVDELEEAAANCKTELQAIHFLDHQARITFQIIAHMADALDRYKRSVDERLTRLERERL